MLYRNRSYQTRVGQVGWACPILARGYMKKILLPLLFLISSLAIAAPNPKTIPPLQFGLYSRPLALRLPVPAQAARAPATMVYDVGTGLFHAISGPVDVVMGTGAAVGTVTTSGSPASGDIGLFSAPTVITGTAANTYVSPLLSHLETGVFTTGAQHEYTVSVLNGPCPYHTIVGGAYTTDALTGCAITPSSGVTNGFTVGVEGLVQVNDPNQGGQYGNVEGVGGNFTAQCAVTNTNCIGGAFIADDITGIGHVLEGIEVSAIPISTTDSGYGILLSMEGAAAQSTNLPAVDIQTPTTGTWTTGLQCDPGATSTLECVNIGQGNSAPGLSGSQAINWNWNDGGGARSMFESVRTNGWKQTAVPDVKTGRVLGALDVLTSNNPIDGWGTALTATSNLAYNELVKIDTSNADSVVPCTTADTSCDGFVADIAGCTAGSNFCGIISGVRKRR